MGFARLCLALAMLFAPLHAFAQTANAPPGQQRLSGTQAPSATPEPPPSPYEPDLLRLAEIMGSLAYLREICAGREAPVWRDKMVALLDAEGRTPARRDRLTAAYNAGFKAYATIHRNCFPATEEASLRLSRDGERLARRLAGRFGG